MSGYRGTAHRPAERNSKIEEDLWSSIAGRVSKETDLMEGLSHQQIEDVREAVYKGVRDHFGIPDPE